MPRLLVTGSSGLIGSEVVDYFGKLGWEVHGVDKYNLEKMKAHYPGWGITKDLKTTFVEIHEAWLERTG